MNMSSGEGEERLLVALYVIVSRVRMFFISELPGRNMCCCSRFSIKTQSAATNC